MNKYYLQDISTLIDVSTLRQMDHQVFACFLNLTIFTFTLVDRQIFVTLCSAGDIMVVSPKISTWFHLDCWCLCQCADVGYHNSLERVTQAYLSRRWRAQDNLSTGLQQLQEAMSGLDQSRDRDKYLQDHFNTFSMPVRFVYLPHDGDQVRV